MLKKVEQKKNIIPEKVALIKKCAEMQNKKLQEKKLTKFVPIFAQFYMSATFPSRKIFCI